MLDKIYIKAVSAVSIAGGYVYLGTEGGRIPVAAIPFNPPQFCGARIIYTTDYYAKIIDINNGGSAIENAPVTLVVLYIRT